MFEVKLNLKLIKLGFSYISRCFIEENRWEETLS